MQADELIEWRTDPDPRLYEWYQRQLDGERGPYHDGDVQAGWFIVQRKRPVSDAFLLPAVLYPVRSNVGDVGYCALLAGHPKDPYDLWTWICDKPITVDRYDELMREVEQDDRLQRIAQQFQPWAKSSFKRATRPQACDAAQSIRYAP